MKKKTNSSNPTPTIFLQRMANINRFAFLDEEEEWKDTGAQQKLIVGKEISVWQRECIQMKERFRKELKLASNASFSKNKRDLLKTNLFKTIASTSRLFSWIKKSVRKYATMLDEIAHQESNAPMGCAHSILSLCKKGETCSCKQAQDDQIRIVKNDLRQYVQELCENETRSLWNLCSGTWWSPFYSRRCLKHPFSVCMSNACDGESLMCSTCLQLYPSTPREVMLINKSNFITLQCASLQIAAVDHGRHAILNTLIKSCVFARDINCPSDELLLSLHALCLTDELDKSEDKECHSNVVSPQTQTHFGHIWCNLTDVSPTRFGIIENPQTQDGKLMAKFWEYMKDKHWTEKSIIDVLDRLK